MERTCTKCFLQKPVDDFPWKYKDRGIRHTVCKECYAKRSNDWYQRNRQSHIKSASINSESYRRQAKEYIFEYLSTHPCVDCGEVNPIVLEFDHLGDKTDTIAHIVVLHRRRRSGTRRNSSRGALATLPLEGWPRGNLAGLPTHSWPRRGLERPGVRHNCSKASAERMISFYAL